MSCPPPSAPIRFIKWDYIKWILFQMWQTTSFLSLVMRYSTNVEWCHLDWTEGSATRMFSVYFCLELWSMISRSSTVPSPLTRKTSLSKYASTNPKFNTNSPPQISSRVLHSVLRRGDYWYRQKKSHISLNFHLETPSLGWDQVCKA